jgi:preprotein translocase subunit SecY
MLRSLRNIWDIPDLRKRVLFTLGLLAVYRLGNHIPTPGINAQALIDFFEQNKANWFGLVDMFSGGNLAKVTVFALGIMPYISASIILQLLTVVWPYLEKLSKEGELGRRKITQYTRYGTVMLSIVQSLGISVYLERMTINQQFHIVEHPGVAFKLMTVLTLTTGTAFIMWLGEQITERGIGNGMSLLITFSILERLWPGTLQLLQFIRSGVVSAPSAVLFLAILVAVIAAVIGMTIAARRIPIQIPRKVMGRGRIREGQKTFIPIRLITAGVMPIIFAQTIIIVPGTLASFTKNPVLTDIAGFFAPGELPYDLTFAVMILLFSYFYTSIIFNSVDLAENLKKQGGFIPGVKPGASTADYIDGVLARITLPGGLFLAGIALLPVLVSKWLGIPTLGFGGTSVLIVVGVLLDTIAQIEQHRTLRKYDGFMKTGRVKFRGRQQRYM